MSDWLNWFPSHPTSRSLISKHRFICKGNIIQWNYGAQKLLVVVFFFFFLLGILSFFMLVSAAAQEALKTSWYMPAKRRWSLVSRTFVLKKEIKQCQRSLARAKLWLHGAQQCSHPEWPHNAPVSSPTCLFMLFVLHTTLFSHLIFLLSLHSGLSTDTGLLPLEEESGKHQKEIVSRWTKSSQNEYGCQTAKTIW